MKGCSSIKQLLPFRFRIEWLQLDYATVKLKVPGCYFFGNASRDDMDFVKPQLLEMRYRKTRNMSSTILHLAQRRSPSHPQAQCDTLSCIMRNITLLVSCQSDHSAYAKSCIDDLLMPNLLVIPWTNWIAFSEGTADC